MSSVVTLARRRSTLPSPCPANSVSLWNILRNNIGKDLSKVAMPVHLNEPLNTLQKLCEELEYSELLDTANQTQDHYQRMVSGKYFTCGLQTGTCKTFKLACSNFPETLLKVIFTELFLQEFEVQIL